MFKPFCFNPIITDLSFIYVYKNNYKGGLTKFRECEHASSCKNFASTSKRAPV